MNIPQIYISEIFRSIQGEGILAGYDTLFIRFQGCHVGCVWCDTKFSWKQNKKSQTKVSELCKHIQNYYDIDKKTWLCITGGEPFEQEQSLVWLVEKLNGSDYKKISIETSGVSKYASNGIVVFPEIKNIVDLQNFNVFFSISPKLKSAIGKRFSLQQLARIYSYWIDAIKTPHKLQFKFVVGSKEDLDIIIQLFETVNISKCDSHVIIQLEDSIVKKKSIVNNIYTTIKKYPNVRLTIQQHKVMKLQ